MLSFLKGGKTNLVVTLDREFGHYYPGDVVRATVTIESEQDLKVQQGRVAFVRREEYQYRYRSASSGKSHGSSYHTAWDTDEQELLREVIIQEGILPAGVPHVYQFEAAIPSDASPSCEGNIVKLKWLAKATLDRKMAPDVNAETEVMVFVVSPGRQAGAGEFGHSNEPREAELALALPGKEWVAGDTVEGQLLVRPQNDFDVSEVRVELVCREYVPRAAGNERLSEIKQQVAGKTHLQNGQALAYPFSLRIPDSSPPTSQMRQSSVSWMLKGVLARSLRADTRVEEEVLVYSGRPE
jgi:hypothetical protein